MSARAGFSERRQVIVFAAPESESGKLIQRSADQLRCQLIERDTDVTFVDITELPDIATVSSGVEQGLLAELARLRGEDGGADFEVVLVGKDGGVKARTSDPDALEDFLALIDTMPMRRAELRSRDAIDSGCE